MKAIALAPSIVRNSSTTSQSIFPIGHTVVNGTQISIPNGALKVGSQYVANISLNKTAAGASSIVVNIRIGTTGTTSDASVAAPTLPPQTAAADDGILTVMVTFRQVGASGIVQADISLVHTLTSTGLANTTSPTSRATSSTVDLSGSGLIICVSLNGGAGSSITAHNAQAQLVL